MPESGYSMAFALYVLVSAVGGLLVGLIGTGSSLVLLPSLVLVFANVLEGYDTLRLAAGTTMATMAVGAGAGALTQHRHGNLEPGLLRLMLLPYALGALVGPWLSRAMPSGMLETYLAAMIVIVAFRMLLHARVASGKARDFRAHGLEAALVLGLIGVCSSIAGIASGVFAIPYLMRFSIPLRTIIGTSTAGAAVYSTFGAIGYASAGWNSGNLPPFALGYVYLPAFVVAAVTAAIATPVGVRLSQHVNETALKRLFAAFLIVVALVIVFR